MFLRNACLSFFPLGRDICKYGGFLSTSPYCFNEHSILKLKAQYHERYEREHIFPSPSICSQRERSVFGTWTVLGSLQAYKVGYFCPGIEATSRRSGWEAAPGGDSKAGEGSEGLLVFVVFLRELDKTCCFFASAFHVYAEHDAFLKLYSKMCCHHGQCQGLHKFTISDAKCIATGGRICRL